MEWLDKNKSRGNEEFVIKGHRLRTEDELICVWNKLSTCTIKDRLSEFVKEPLERHKITPQNKDCHFVPQTTLDSIIISNNKTEEDGSSSGSRSKSPDSGVLTDETVTKKRKSSEEDQLLEASPNHKMTTTKKLVF